MKIRIESYSCILFPRFLFQKEIGEEKQGLINAIKKEIEDSTPNSYSFNQTVCSFIEYTDKIKVYSFENTLIIVDNIEPGFFQKEYFLGVGILIMSMGKSGAEELKQKLLKILNKEFPGFIDAKRSKKEKDIEIEDLDWGSFVRQELNIYDFLRENNFHEIEQKEVVRFVA